MITDKVVLGPLAPLIASCVTLLTPALLLAYSFQCSSVRRDAETEAAASSSSRAWSQASKEALVKSGHRRQRAHASRRTGAHRPGLLARWHIALEYLSTSTSTFLHSCILTSYSFSTSHSFIPFLSLSLFVLCLLSSFLSYPRRPPTTSYESTTGNEGLQPSRRWTPHPAPGTA